MSINKSHLRFSIEVGYLLTQVAETPLRHAEFRGLKMIPESHPLQELFQDLVGRHYGKESYYIVSKFEHFEYAKVAPLFASLSKNFEGCVYGLNMVKNDLEEMQHPIVRRTEDLIM